MKTVNFNIIKKSYIYSITGFVRLLTIIILLALKCSINSIAQFTTPENFYTIKAREDSTFDQLYLLFGDSIFHDENFGYGQYRQWLNYWEPQLYPHGDFTIAYNAMQQLYQNSINVNSGQFKNIPSANWIELGPFNHPIENISVLSGGVGRVQFFAFDPQNSNNMFTGSPVGGLYYSTDGGNTWNNGGTDVLPMIGVAHCAVDPNNSDTWFIATGDGEGFGGNGSCCGSVGWNQSIGIFRTTDRGVTWNIIGDKNLLNGTVWGWQIKKLLIDPFDGNIIYAATDRGIYKTNNALAADPNNVTWTLLPTGGSNNNNYYDIEFKPGSNSIIYASGKYANGQAIIWSTDFGAAWSPMPNTGFLTANIDRIAMEVTPANPDFIYAVFIYNNASAKMYRYDASTQVWQDKGIITGGVAFRRAQSIGVSPIDADLVYLGNVQPIYKCTTGGDGNPCTWVKTPPVITTQIRYIMT